MVLTVSRLSLDEEGLSADPVDLLDFADLIGPGGKGLKRDREDEDSEEDEDDDDLDLDLDLEADSDEEEDEDEEEGLEDSDMYDTDPDDLAEKHGRPREPSELYGGGDDEDEEEAEIDLSEDEPTDVKDEGDGTPVAATKYVPPHMRAAQLAEKAQGSKEKALSRQKLERKLQGLLNKLVSMSTSGIVLISDCQRRIWIVLLVALRRCIAIIVEMVCWPIR